MSRARKLTRRSILCGLSLPLALSLVPMADALAKQPFPRGAGRPPAGVVTLTTYQDENTSASASLGYKVHGMIFPENAVPPGTRVSINGVVQQFDLINRWPNGSLRRAVATTRDTNFAGSESRTYTVVRETGSFDNSSTVTLATVLAETNFNIAFTNMSGSTTGAFADHAASFNTHAAIATRVTKYAAGPVMDAWHVWGMASAGGVEHKHLKVEWYVKRFKDAAGNLAFYEVLPCLHQDWWTPRGTVKESLNYDAALTNGVTSIQSYLNVVHMYGMNWAMCRMDNDFQHGTPHCIGATKPMLNYKPNKRYWIDTGIVPPYDLGISFVMPAYLNTYVPGSCFSHRGDIVGTAHYMGRGLMPNTDGIAFCTQTAANVRTARINAFAGFHIPTHRRVDGLRQRPSTIYQVADASQDIANTAPSPIFWDERSSGTPSTYYDFQAYGLPAPGHYYISSLTNGYTQPTGSNTSGGTTWVGVDDLAHATSYSFYIALLEGEKHFIDDVISHGMRPVQAMAQSAISGQPWSVFYRGTSEVTYPGRGTVQWSGVALRADNVGATRAAAWPIQLMSDAAALCPDDDPHSQIVKRTNEVNAKYMATDFSIVPSSIYGPWVPWEGAPSPWMDIWIACFGYMAFQRTKDPNYLIIGNHVAKLAISQALFNNIGMSGTFRAMYRPRNELIRNASTNEFFANGKMFDIRIGTPVPISISAATDRITVPNVHKYYSVDWTAGDEIVPSDYNQQVHKPIPTEMPAGQIYYVANPDNVAGTFQVARDAGLTDIIDFTADYPDILLGVRPQKAADPAYFNYAQSNAVDRPAYMMAAAVLALRNGHPDMTTELMQKYYDFLDSHITWTGDSNFKLRHTS